MTLLPTEFIFLLARGAPSGSVDSYAIDELSKINNFFNLKEIGAFWLVNNLQVLSVVLVEENQQKLV